MKTREEVLNYGLSFPGTYQNAPFHDENWQLVRVRKNKKLKRMIAESYDLVAGAKKL